MYVARIVILEGEGQAQHTEKVYQKPTRGPAEKVSVQCLGPLSSDTIFILTHGMLMLSFPMQNPASLNIFLFQMT